VSVPTEKKGSKMRCHRTRNLGTFPKYYSGFIPFLPLPTRKWFSQTNNTKNGKKKTNKKWWQRW